MKKIILLLFVFLSFESYAQRRDFQLINNDARFTVSAQTSWAAGNEEIFFYVDNNTNDEYVIVIDVTITSYCHPQKSFKLGVNNVVHLKPGGRFIPQGDWSHIFLGGEKQKDCRKPLQGEYTYVSSISFSISNVENRTEQNRQKEKEKAEKERAEKEKLEKEKAEKERLEKEKASKNIHSSGSSDNFWGDSPNTNTNRNTTSTGSSSQTNSNSKNNDYRAATTFSGGLDDIKEGGYFKDDKGNYYRKEGNGAQIVDKATYERAQNDAMAIHIASENQRIQANIERSDRMISDISTSFYAMQAAGRAREGLRSAGQLDGFYSNLEELNQAFYQKMSEIRYRAEEYRIAASNSVSAYSQALSSTLTTPTEQAYGAAISGIGQIVAQIGADNAEKRAREELARQRAAQEAQIKENERIALVGIRDEIIGMFPEGGMPLSKHNINIPVLYVFAYKFDRTNWQKNEYVPLSVSNVIPVYQQSDGTYPYVSNVKRTFEGAGISTPVMVGYFTDKKLADKYQQSLIGTASDAKFNLNMVNVKVKEQSVSEKTSNIDFWGENKKGGKSETAVSEKDFWGLDSKDNKGNTTNKNNSFATQSKKNNSQKTDDNNFWGL